MTDLDRTVQQIKALELSSFKCFLSKITSDRISDPKAFYSLLRAITKYKIAFPLVTRITVENNLLEETESSLAI
jgi:4-hydroxy-3-methylbut-2-en-1-yl diphosphate synthase IspG/GcpE